MRKLVWAAAGFGLAALAAEYILPETGLPYIAAALGVCSLLSLLLRGRRRRAALLVTLAAAAGLVSWWARYELYLAPAEALAGEERTITARMRDYPELWDNYIGLPVTVTDGAPKGRAYLYCYEDDGALPPLEPGDVVTVRVRVQSALTGRTGQRVHTYAAAGQRLVGRVLGGVEATGASERRWVYFPQRLAHTLAELCGALFPKDAAPFMTALMTGEKTDLYQDALLYRQMRSAGVLHIAAVSGMHIVILVSFLQLLLGRSRRSSLLCIPVMVLFVLLAGATASVVRAALMQSLLLLAPLFEREYDSPTGVAAALLAILLGNPMAVGGVGFQLSFACVLGFVVLLSPLYAWCAEHLPMTNFFIRFAADSLLCTFCATVFSLPLAACYFGVIPLFAWLANLLTLPVVELCFAGGYVVCAVGAVLPAAGALLGGALAWAARWCMLVYRLIAAIPGGCLYTVRESAVLWLAGCYVLFIAWWLLRRRGVRVLFWLPAELCVIGLCAVLLTGGLSLRAGGELDVLDVGQGECVLLLDETAAVVVDCGGSGRTNAGDAAANWLLSRGKTSVDVLILTHLHADHTNGVTALMARLPVGTMILPADHDDEDQMLDELLAAAALRDTTVLFLDRECEAAVGDIGLTLRLPEAGSEENERGIVVLAALRGWTALIMGDAGQGAERALLSRGLIPDVDALVVGHHGSKTATSMLFLRAARPETAAISVGAGNPYGHPAEESLDRLALYGAQVLRTDEDGTLVIRPGAGERNYG